MVKNSWAGVDIVPGQLYVLLASFSLVWHIECWTENDDHSHVSFNIWNAIFDKTLDSLFYFNQYLKSYFFFLDFLFYNKR